MQAETTYITRNWKSQVNKHYNLGIKDNFDPVFSEDLSKKFANLKTFV